MDNLSNTPVVSPVLLRKFSSNCAKQPKVSTQKDDDDDDDDV